MASVPPSLPDMIAVMLAQSPEGYPEVIRLVPVVPGRSLNDQLTRASSPWMNPDDRIVTTYDESEGSVIGQVITYDDEVTDILVMTVPPERRRQAIYRWVKGINQDPGPRESFTLDLALKWWAEAVEAWKHGR